MLFRDREALECDLAETYGIYNYRELPVSRVALFASGLRANSRIKMKIMEARATQTELLLATIADRLSMLVWFQSKDGQKGINRPPSIVEAIMADPKQKEQRTFTSGDAFRREWERLTKRR